MKPHQLAICARWRYHEARTHAIVEHDEFTPPFGETLLHMAAYVGHARLIERLLTSGARPARPGMASGCSALHAAAAADHAELCGVLIQAGAKVGAASSQKKHTALHMACLKGLASVACALVKHGADPYDAGEASDSPMALLRAQKTEQARALWGTLDTLSLSPRHFLQQAPPTGSDDEMDLDELDDAPKILKLKRTVSENEEHKVDQLFDRATATAGTHPDSEDEEIDDDDDDNESDGEDSGSHDFASARSEEEEDHW